MVAMAGYRQTEVGEIPNDWCLEPIGNHFTFKNGLNKAKEFFGFGTPIVNYMDVYKNPGIKASNILGLVSVSNAEIESFGVRKGDVFFTRTSETVEEIGISSVLLDETEKTVFSGFILRARPKNQKLNLYFKKYCFSSNLVRKQIASKSTYTTRALTNGRVLSDVLLPYPNIENEQNAIAAALSDADALIESLEKLIEKKRQIKQGAMQELLTGKKRLTNYQNSAPFKKTELGFIPIDWQIKRLPEITVFRGGKAHEQFISELGSYICVNSKFISSDAQVVKYSTKNFCTAFKNDVLMVMSDLPNGKALAKAFLVDIEDKYAVNQRVCALTPITDHAKFLYYKLNRNPYFLKFDNGVSQTHLLNDAFKKCIVSMPPTFEEQSEISKILSDMDLELSELDAKLSKARQIKQGMMQELLTGRIRLV